MELNYTELVKAAQQHNDAALTTLFQETYKETYFIAKQTLRNNAEAEDIVQDAYIKAFQSLDMLQNPQKFKSWLHQIVVNKCKDYLKKKKPSLFADMIMQTEDDTLEYEDTLYSETVEYQPDAMMDRKAMVEIFDQIFDTLSEEQRLCIILYYREQLSVKEIAELLQVSESTIKSRLNYGRRKVKEQVEQYEKEGLKLYSGMPIILWALRHSGGEQITIPENMLPHILSSLGGQATASIGGAEAASASRAAIKGGTQAAAIGKTTSGGKVAAGVAAGIKTKVVAGVVAAAIAVGGGSVIVPSVIQHNNVQKVEKAYERLLCDALWPGDVDRNYYAYVDLNGDKIPELLLSDEPGEAGAAYELYQCKDGLLQRCDKAHNSFDAFYVVNGEALLTGTKDGGDTYTFLPEDGPRKEFYIETTDFSNRKQFYKKSGTMSEYEEGEQAELTEEEYQYFSNAEGGQIIRDGFVQTIEPIVFEQNTMRPPVEAKEEELEQLLPIADIFYKNPDGDIIGQWAYAIAAAYYGGGLYSQPTDFFSPIDKIEMVDEDYGNTYEILVYDEDSFRNFFRNTLGKNLYLSLPRFTGSVNWDDFYYVYEKDEKVYILLDGIGDPLFASAELVDYQENDNGTATATYRRIDDFGIMNSASGEYSSKLTVRRNPEGGLQVVTYEDIVE